MLCRFEKKLKSAFFANKNKKNKAFNFDSIHNTSRARDQRYAYFQNKCQSSNGISFRFDSRVLVFVFVCPNKMYRNFEMEIMAKKKVYDLTGMIIVIGGYGC